MSPYEHVVAGAKYPAMLVTAGMNDHRVPPWQPAKLAARFQAATASGKPVLFRVEWNAGHGIGSSKAQRDEQYADFYAFARLATGEDAANSQ
jgi:prolyl oligopeptidase